MFIDSSAFVDPIDEIRNLATKMKQTVRLISSINKRRLNDCIENKKESWLILTDINLFNDDLLQIRVINKKQKIYIKQIFIFRILFYHQLIIKFCFFVILYITTKYHVSN